jgi:hypothetical protein
MDQRAVAVTIAKRFLDLGIFCLKIAEEHNLAAMRTSAEWFQEQAKLIHQGGIGSVLPAHFITIQDFEQRIAWGVDEPIQGKLGDWLALLKDAHTAAIQNQQQFDVTGTLVEAKDTIDNAQHAMEAFTDAASKNRKSVATAATLMLVAITRAETLEHRLRLQAKHLLKVARRPGKHDDLAQGFVALGPLIGTKDGPRSELRCIRIGSSHAYYRVAEQDGDWRVTFRFPSGEFEKEYSRTQFEAVVDNYYLFYQLLVALLTTHELKVLLAAVLVGHANSLRPRSSERRDSG